VGWTVNPKLSNKVVVEATLLKQCSKLSPRSKMSSMYGTFSNPCFRKALRSGFKSLVKIRGADDINTFGRQVY
jgi:hypothetical protein